MLKISCSIYTGSQFPTYPDMIVLMGLTSPTGTISIMIVSSVIICSLIWIFFHWMRMQKIDHQFRVNEILGEVGNQTAMLAAMSLQKEWLVNELQHRVKNNLQMVISLLNSQGNYLKSEEAVSVLRKSRHRLFAISLAHQIVYAEENHSKIDAAQYLQEIAGYLKDEYNAGDDIMISFNTENLQLDVNQAVPFGLIINEAVSNSFEYAFPNQSGTLALSLNKIDDQTYRLAIADDGVGLPINGDESHRMLGINLMEGLSHQLEGIFEQSGINGVIVSVNFRPNNIN